MVEKNKISTSKSNGKRMPEIPAPNTAKTLETGRSGAPGGGAAPAAWNAQRQLAAFESAIKLFHTRSFSPAREHFEQAARGPERDVAQRAKLHVAMCERRLAQDAVHLDTAEDYYNYGVALINTRKLEEARQHLARALEMSPKADHVYYALGVAQALGGDLFNAYENLKRAIEIEPRNRLIARQDADLTPVANQPPFDSLLYPEKKSW